MATENEVVLRSEEEGEFDFEDWTKKLKLPRKVIQILRTEELVSREALSLVESRDLKELGLPLGCVKLIIKDVGLSKQDSAPVVPKDANDAILENAGNTLDLLLLDNKDSSVSAPTGPTNQMDPRTILTMKATSHKATHITQFLTEKCKRRRQNRRREYVLRAGQTDETLVLRTEEEHPYLGIYLEEWGAANMRLMNHILTTGELKRQDNEFYLAYTTRIFGFAGTYEWNSVLNFDHSYRELQAEHGFQWGTFSPHMELQLLVAKRSKQGVEAIQRQPRQASHGIEDCRIFKAKGACPFGANCRYRHPKLMKQTTTATGEEV